MTSNRDEPPFDDDEARYMLSELKGLLEEGRALARSGNPAVKAHAQRAIEAIQYDIAYLEERL